MRGCAGRCRRPRRRLGARASRGRSARSSRRRKRPGLHWPIATDACTLRARPGRATRTRRLRRRLLSGPPPPALPPPPCAGGAGATGPSGADAPPPKEGRAARTTAVRTGPPHALPLPLPAGQADAPLGKHEEPPLRGPPPPPQVPQPTLLAGRAPWGKALLTHRRRGTPLRGPQRPRPPPPPRRGRAARAQPRRMPRVRGPPPPTRSCAACATVWAELERGQNQFHHTHMALVPFLEKRRNGHVGICLCCMLYRW